MKDNVCKVLMRMEYGDEIVCSVTTPYGVGLDESAFRKLKRAVSQKIKPALDDSIYFTVRVTLNNIKDNWRCTSVNELNSVIRGVFHVEEDIIEG